MSRRSASSAISPTRSPRPCSSAFSPPPKAQSALLTLRRRPVPLHPGAADEPYRAFLRAAFAERRKMLWKNLARRATPAALTAGYDALGLARNARAEELSPDLP